jgi:hypothetical protein
MKLQSMEFEQILTCLILKLCFTVHCNFTGAEAWQAAIPYVPNTSQFIGDLTPGLTYQFRVSSNNNVTMSDPSQPSQPVTIPFECGKSRDTVKL